MRGMRRRWVFVTILLLLLDACVQSGPRGPTRSHEAGSTPGPTGSVPSTRPTRPTTRTPSFVPSQLAFLDATHGLAGGQMLTRTCDWKCPSAIKATSDGGRTWHVVYRIPGPVTSLTASGPDQVWALAARCYGQGCPSQVLASSDGGRKWTQVGGPLLGFSALSFVAPNLGWALRFEGSAWVLTKTTDGARTWRTIGRPCPREAQGASLRFVSPVRGWLLCASEPGAGMQPKVLLATADGGKSWRRVAGEWVSSQGSGVPAVGLKTGGYPNSMFFLPDGHGWIGLNDDAVILGTLDGGGTWRQIGGRVSEYQAGPLWFLDDSYGFAIAGSGDRLRLLSTRDGGRTWTAVHAWMGPI